MHNTQLDKASRIFIKIAGSKLRSMVSIIKAPSPAGTSVWDLTLNKKSIGTLAESGGKVINVGIDSKFRGMGLGKKLYGEIARRQSNLKLTSMSDLSEDAARIYRSIGKGKNIKLHTAKDIKYTAPGEAEKFLPEELLKTLKRSDRFNSLGAGRYSSETGPVFKLTMPPKSRK